MHKIVIVEDDHVDYVLMQSIVSEALNGRVDFIWCPDYDEAIKLIDANQHDIYFVDYNLNPRDGLELAHYAQSNRNFDKPLILVTGQEDYEIDKAATEAGATDYIVKKHLSAPVVERSIRYSLKQKQTEKRLRHLALNDSLTGLANRTLFGMKLSDDIAHAKRANTMIAVMMLDLDGFKSINDTLGHAAGDSTLQVVAERLEACVRESDTVARFGGDEFAIILTYAQDAKQLCIVAEKILSSLNKSFEISGERASTSASIGVGLYPNDAQDPSSLLKCADLALYEAKGAGKNKYQFHNNELNSHLRANTAMQGDIHGALKDGQFSLHYQPIFNLCDDTIDSIEVLLRWNHPEKGPITPNEFLPIADSIGLMPKLSECVVDLLEKEVKIWSESALPDYTINVNVSETQLKDRTLYDALSKDFLSWERVNLDLDESVLQHSGNRVSKVLAKIHENGARLSIHNFGKSEPSLSLFQQFKIDTIKIDGSIVRNIGLSKNDEAFSRIVVAIGEILGLSVIANSVETEEQLEFLTSIGCRKAQGFMLCPPLSSQDFVEWHHNYSSATEQIAVG
ncbi:MAG: EAL domain-containing protein [Pseudomonadota bacterium]